MRMEELASRGPPLMLEEFFSGALCGWGVVLDPFGNPRRHFTVEVDGRYDANVGLSGPAILAMDETYRFDTGAIDRLEWRIRVLSEGRYEGQEPSLAGLARGERQGNAVRWVYRRALPLFPLAMDFDDWFWRADATRVLVRARCGRLGLRFGGLVVCYRHGRSQADQADAESAVRALLKAPDKGAARP